MDYPPPSLSAIFPPARFPKSPAPGVKPLPFLHVHKAPASPPLPSSLASSSISPLPPPFPPYVPPTPSSTSLSEEFTRYVAHPKPSMKPTFQDAGAADFLQVQDSLAQTQDENKRLTQRVVELQEQQRILSSRAEQTLLELSHFKDATQSLSEREMRLAEREEYCRQVKAELKRRAKEYNQRVRTVNEASRELATNMRTQELESLRVERDHLKEKLQSTELALSRSQHIVESLSIEKVELEQVIHSTNLALLAVRDPLPQRLYEDTPQLRSSSERRRRHQFPESSFPREILPIPLPNPFNPDESTTRNYRADNNDNDNANNKDNNNNNNNNTNNKDNNNTNNNRSNNTPTVQVARSFNFVSPPSSSSSSSSSPLLNGRGDLTNSPLQPRAIDMTGLSPGTTVPIFPGNTKVSGIASGETRSPDPHRPTVPSGSLSNPLRGKEDGTPSPLRPPPQLPFRNVSTRRMAESESGGNCGNSSGNSGSNSSSYNGSSSSYSVSGSGGGSSGGGGGCSSSSSSSCSSSSSSSSGSSSGSSSSSSSSSGSSSGHHSSSGGRSGVGNIISGGVSPRGFRSDSGNDGNDGRKNNINAQFMGESLNLKSYDKSGSGSNNSSPLSSPTNNSAERTAPQASKPQRLFSG